MARQLVKINEHGRVIGQDHPLAKLTDLEVDLIRAKMDERQEFIEMMKAKGFNQRVIRDRQRVDGLTVYQIAEEYGVSHQTVWLIFEGKRRAQSCAGHREVKGE